LISVQDFQKRYEDARSVAIKWQTKLDPVYKYVMPNEGDFTQTVRVEGERHDQDIWDPTIQNILKQYASTIMTKIFGQKLLSVKLLSKTAEFEQGDKTIVIDQKKIDQYVDTWYSALQENSKALRHIYQTLKEAAISTGVMLCNTDNSYQYFRIQNIPLRRVCFNLNEFGEPLDVFTNNTIQKRLIFNRWPFLKIDALPKEIKTLKDDENLEYIEGVVWCQDLKRHNKGYWLHLVLFSGTQEYVIKRELNHNPYVVCREDWIPNETFGRGCFFDNQSNIFATNDLSQGIMEGAGYNLLPMFVTTGSEINDQIDISPGQTIHSKGLTPDPIKQLNTQVNLPPSMQYRASLRQEISDSLGINPLGSVSESHQMTKYEASERLAQSMPPLRNKLNAYIDELLKPMFLITFDMVSEANNWPIKSMDFLEGKKFRIQCKNPILDVENKINMQNVDMMSDHFNGVFGQDLGPLLMAYNYDPFKYAHSLRDIANLPSGIDSSEDFQNILKQRVNQMLNPQPSPAQQLQQQSDAPTPQTQDPTILNMQGV